MKRCKKVAGVILAAGIAATTVALGSGTVNAAPLSFFPVLVPDGRSIDDLVKICR